MSHGTTRTRRHSMVFLMMTLPQLGLGEEKPSEPEGILLGSKATTLEDIYDAKSKTYLLYPGAPLAKDMKLLAHARTGIIDSGIARSHPQIAGLVVAERDWTNEGVEDVVGHGTIVTLGIIYGTPLKPDPQRRLLEEKGLKNMTPGIVVAKVAPCKGPIKVSHVIEAINWMAEQNVNIVNISLGFTGEPEQFEDLRKALRSHPDILFVAAAGNYGPHRKVYPAALDAENIISVAEEDSTTSGHGMIVSPTIYRPVSPVRYAESLQEVEFLQAMDLREEKKDEESKLLFKKITQTPGHVRASDAWLQLAVYEAAQGAFDDALPLLDHAEKLTTSDPPKLAYIVAIRGYVFFNKGDFLAAETALRRSISINNSDAKAHYTLGITYLRLKKIRSALAQFQATAQIDPKYPELQKILDALQKADKRGELPAKE